MPRGPRSKDSGALKGKGLELIYLADPVDLFFMQIQGSGRVEAHRRIDHSRCTTTARMGTPIAPSAAT